MGEETEQLPAASAVMGTVVDEYDQLGRTSRHLRGQPYHPVRPDVTRSLMAVRFDIALRGYHAGRRRHRLRAHLAPDELRRASQSSMCGSLGDGR
jgi:hypothetical protein